MESRYWFPPSKLFEGKRNLFKGLAIEKLEKEWTEYPVLHFDLSGGKHMEKDQLERYLGFILEMEEKNGVSPNHRLMPTTD